MSLMKPHVTKYHKETVENKCDEVFINKLSSVIHKRTHSAFKCEKCNFKGISKKALNIHIGKIHMEKGTPIRGTKREPMNQSPNETENLKGEKHESGEPMEHIKKKVKASKTAKQNLETKLPLKESDVIGGAGWNLKEKVTELPPKVIKALPEYKDYTLHQVCGDGSCCFRCIAVHLGKNEEEGLDLSRQYNKQLSQNREVASKSISFPKTITVSTQKGIKKETFEDTVEDRKRYFDYHETEEATFIWRESADMIAIATYFNIPIEVVVIRESGEIELPTQKYRPDGDYEQKQEEKPKITLLNSSDHFNLIKPKLDVTEKYKPLMDTTEASSKTNTKTCKLCSKIESTNDKLEEHIEQMHSREVINELKAENVKLKEIVYNQKDRSLIEPLQTPHVTETLGPQWKPAPKAPRQPNLSLARQQPMPKPKLQFSHVWNCDKCHNVFSTGQLLEKHIENEHRGITEQNMTAENVPKVNLGEECAELFTTQTQLKQHKKKSHQNKWSGHIETENIFKAPNVKYCDKCDEEFTTEIQYKQHMNNIHQSIPMETEEETENTTETNYICRVCKVERNTLNKLERHMANHDEDGDWYCEMCPFQSNNIKHLRTHMKEQSHCFELLHFQVVKCTFCSNTFKSRMEMTKHRKETHYTFKPCKNLNVCVFKEECIFNHDPILEGLHRCFQCGNDFQTKNEMMIHRKNTHEGVKTCKNFVNNKCRRDWECWWKHDNQSKQNLDFQQNPENLAPPIISMREWPLISDQTNQTIPKMIQMIEQNLAMIKNMCNMLHLRI